MAGATGGQGVVAGTAAAAQQAAGGKEGARHSRVNRRRATARHAAVLERAGDGHGVQDGDDSQPCRGGIGQRDIQRRRVCRRGESACRN